MLHRLVQLDNLSESIKLIEFNDEENQYDPNFDINDQIGCMYILSFLYYLENFISFFKFRCRF